VALSRITCSIKADTVIGQGHCRRIQGTTIHKRGQETNTNNQIKRGKQTNKKEPKSNRCRKGKATLPKSDRSWIKQRDEEQLIEQQKQIEMCAQKITKRKEEFDKNINDFHVEQVIPNSDHHAVQRKRVFQICDASPSEITQTDLLFLKNCLLQAEENISENKVRLENEVSCNQLQRTTFRN
jgi:hypothetical protein